MRPLSDPDGDNAVYLRGLFKAKQERSKMLT